MLTTSGHKTFLFYVDMCVLRRPKTRWKKLKQILQCDAFEKCKTDLRKVSHSLTSLHVRCTLPLFLHLLCLFLIFFLHIYVYTLSTFLQFLWLVATASGIFSLFYAHNHYLMAASSVTAATSRQLQYNFHILFYDTRNGHCMNGQMLSFVVGLKLFGICTNNVHAL